MKTYLDFQIWDYITKDREIEEYFKNKEEWDYLISVAHLEELYKAKRAEKGDKIGLSDKLKNKMLEMSMDGVIKPTEHGVKFEVKGFEKAYQYIINVDTQDTIFERSLVKRDLEEEAYEAKDLFEGIKHNKDDEYKLVWETERVKEELNKLKNENSQLFIELSDSNNSFRKDMEKSYGKVVTNYMLQKLINSSKTEIKPGIYLSIMNDYHVLEYVMEKLYIKLTKCGFKRDKSDRHANSGTYDIQHSICATLCDIFITNDDGFANKFKAISFYLGIPIKILTWKKDILPQIHSNKDNV
ncbi:hypothetical protein FDC27_09955 [Clostridium botulinum]|uniref:hypothetical protein n=1 Tax=Clostridium botulinum TaxID=1491 RepID=UPI0013C86079|nr:hypothetical protein [Clostridium botulinum]MBY7025048.1 hypothetical protein [Clostridium botulinum]NFE75502.1 hypothetical protein [Clostridium botulinum]NFG26068.1 hypothetical protein [Clostridium botulinum]NFL59277.1 hypothetical protein [Clostridium botulinum]NFL63197.1 hypothetical protein [Clostridium botulinum]